MNYGKFIMTRCLDNYEYCRDEEPALREINSKNSIRIMTYKERPGKE